MARNLTVPLAKLTAWLGCCALLGSCGQPQAPTATAEKQIATTPNRVQYARIVSLAPSNTELLYSLGAETKLVGRSRFCDYPPQVKDKMVVGDFVQPNVERLAQVKPDVVLLVNGQESMAGLLKKHHFNTNSFNNLRIEEIPQNLRTLGNMTGTAAKAELLAAHFEQSVAALRHIVGAANHPKVLFVAWPQPLMTAGQLSFVHDCITTSGGINVAADLKTSYPHLSQERLLLSQPDVIIFPHEAEQQTFWKAAPWTSLKAIQNKRFYFLPATDVDGLSRPTLRVIDGLYWLASRIHPEDSNQLSRWHQRTRQQATASGVNPRRY